VDTKDTREKCGVFGVVARGDNKEDNVAKISYTGLFQLQHRGRESAGISAWSDNAISTHKGMGTIDWVFREQVPRKELIEFTLEHPNKKHLARYIRNNGNLSRDKRRELLLKKKRELLDIALDIFEERNIRNPLDDLRGKAAIGHVRYSTTGASGAKNVQPIVFSFRGQDVALAHNGNIKTEALEEIISARGGYEREDTTDTGLIVALIATSDKTTFVEALIETLELLEGAFSLVILHAGRVYAVKDRFGIRPLCVGRTDTHLFAASESRALDNFRAEFMGEVAPGAIAVLDSTVEEPFMIHWTEDASIRRCMFEDAYFSMPDSLGAGGKRIMQHRTALGAEAAREHPILDADVVTPILDSGLFQGLGYSQELEMIYHQKEIDVRLDGLFHYAFIRGRVERTFMEPIASVRKLLQNLKFSIIPEVVEGKHVVVVDDSTVRGNVMPYIIETLRFFRARKVSVVIPLPPLRHPCHLGVDLPFREDYIAHNRTIEEIAREIGLKLEEGEYLGYLSLEGMYKALGVPRHNFCDGCLTNEYPVPLPVELTYNPKKK